MRCGARLQCNHLVDRGLATTLSPVVKAVPAVCIGAYNATIRTAVNYISRHQHDACSEGRSAQHSSAKCFPAGCLCRDLASAPLSEICRAFQGPISDQRAQAVAANKPFLVQAG